VTDDRGQAPLLLRFSVAAASGAYVLAVYGLVVLVGGALLGAASPSVPLAVIATAVVALTFEPVRRALRRQLPATPYDVLAEFATQVSAAAATEDFAPRVARRRTRRTGRTLAPGRRGRGGR
jgi:hypothetical protein